MLIEDKYAETIINLDCISKIQYDYHDDGSVLANKVCLVFFVDKRNFYKTYYEDEPIMRDIFNKMEKAYLENEKIFKIPFKIEKSVIDYY